MEWINDNTYYCTYCKTTFRVYVKDQDPSVNFCPICASRELETATENED